MNFELPHRRYNPLTLEWVLVSPHRARRPWLGQVEKPLPEAIPGYDPSCYLCPGNARVGGERNPAYTGTYVFDNDFQALLTPQRAQAESESVDVSANLKSQEAYPSIFNAQAEFGISRVVCFSPRHDLSLPEMSEEAVRAVIETWSEQTRQLGALDYIRHIQVFENKGAMMGASNPHPHSQIWASSSVPTEPAKELASLVDYERRHGTCLLCDMLLEERRLGERVVVENDHFSALVPFWAIWPFEILLMARRHAASLADLLPDEVTALADILRRITARYDNVFEISFPYSMGFHQSPVDGLSHTECHLHAHYYPPLLRSATVKKFMVGFEMLAMPQRDLTPETAAQRLRGLSDVHYKLQRATQPVT
jgi:UDPglucose--hexose-1-phosphate uridylyltransferase